jgi:hypothetical protein
MIGDILKEAQAEINEETAKEVKAKIKTQLKKIAAAKQVVTNLEVEYKALVAQLSVELGATT